MTISIYNFKFSRKWAQMKVIFFHEFKSDFIVSLFNFRIEIDEAQTVG